MNVDTDTQWAYWEGILKFYKEKEDYLQGQIGNPEGPTKACVLAVRLRIRLCKYLNGSIPLSFPCSFLS